MRFYITSHRYSCGIDLHARTMYVCILNLEGAIVFHRNPPSAPDAFLEALAAYREDLVAASSDRSRSRSSWKIACR